VLLTEGRATLSLQGGGTSLNARAKAVVINEDVIKTHEVSNTIGLMEKVAHWIEGSVDTLHNFFTLLGIKNSYGLSIIAFTFLSKYNILSSNSAFIESNLHFSQISYAPIACTAS
jgi:hypothetical protein